MRFEEIDDQDGLVPDDDFDLGDLCDEHLAEDEDEDDDLEFDWDSLDDEDFDSDDDEAY